MSRKNARKREAARRAAAHEMERPAACRRPATEAERSALLDLAGGDLPDFTLAGAPPFNPYLDDGDIHAARFGHLDDVGGGP